MLKMYSGSNSEFFFGLLNKYLKIEIFCIWLVDSIWSHHHQLLSKIYPISCMNIMAKSSSQNVVWRYVDNSFLYFMHTYTPEQ